MEIFKINSLVTDEQLVYLALDSVGRYNLLGDVELIRICLQIIANKVIMECVNEGVDLDDDILNDRMSNKLITHAFDRLASVGVVDQDLDGNIDLNKLYEIATSGLSSL